MESNSFYDMYLEELKAIDQGTPDEVNELLERLSVGDKTSVSRLTELKLASVAKIAEEYSERGLPMGDLVQEANMALLMFLNEYQGSDFDIQMEEKVRQAIEDALEVQNTEMKIEEEMAARVNVLKDISASMARELGREATLAELAERMKMTEDEIREIMKTTMNAMKVNINPEDTSQEE